VTGGDAAFDSGVDEVHAEGFFDELDARGESEDALDGSVDDSGFVDGLADEVAHRLLVCA